MNNIDNEYVKTLARGAKLDFTGADLQAWQEQLAVAAGWVEKISGADTSADIDAPAGAGVALRPDEVKPFAAAQTLIADFPSSERNMAKVKKIL